AAAVILNLIHAALASILATAETDMQNTGHSEQIAVAVGVVEAFRDPRARAGKVERHAHQRKILRIGLRLELQRVQNAIEPFRTRRKPSVDAIDRIVGYDLTQKNFRSVRIAPIEQRITPRQPRVTNPKNTPADQPPPLANRDDE